MKLRDLGHLSREDLLDALGLEPERKASDWLLPGVGLFTLGLLVGAGMGLLASPRLAHRAQGRLEEGWERARETLEQATHS